MSVWLITGCSSGFGKDLALLALHSGHKVIATSRNPSKTPELVSEVEGLGGKWMELDVCSPDLSRKIEEALSLYGHIDVLVNNAGYSLHGAVENISEKEARSLMDTNFFAPFNIIRNILPSMRERKSGTIVNMSSGSGLIGFPSCGLYAASKFALEGLSEALSYEVAPFGIRVFLIEPGGFNTSFVSNITMAAAPMHPDYEGTPADNVIKGMKSMIGNQGGDPQKACQVIFDLVAKTGLANQVKGEFLRIPLGTDCGVALQGKINTLQKTVDGTKVLWQYTDTGKKGATLQFEMD